MSAINQYDLVSCSFTSLLITVEFLLLLEKLLESFRQLMSFNIPTGESVGIDNWCLWSSGPLIFHNLGRVSPISCFRPTTCLEKELSEFQQIILGSFQLENGRNKEKKRKKKKRPNKYCHCSICNNSGISSSVQGNCCSCFEGGQISAARQAFGLAPSCIMIYEDGLYQVQVLSPWTAPRPCGALQRK